jgi:hypothetical protein
MSETDTKHDSHSQVRTQGKLDTNLDQPIERRSSRRFQVVLTLLLRWRDGVDQYAAGQSANICERGMFLFAERTPPLGVDVEIEFVLPPFGGVSHSTRIRGVGRVIRFEASGCIKGFAVAGSFVNRGQDKGGNA